MLETGGYTEVPCLAYISQSPSSWKLWQQVYVARVSLIFSHHYSLSISAGQQPTVYLILLGLLIKLLPFIAPPRAGTKLCAKPDENGRDAETYPIPIAIFSNWLRPLFLSLARVALMVASPVGIAGLVYVVLPLRSTPRVLVHVLILSFQIAEFSKL